MSGALFLDPQEAINTYKTNIGALVPNWLMQREELSDGAKLLYARLQQYQGADGDIMPKLATLASELGKSERQTQNLIAELRDIGLIRVIDRRNECKCNMYELLAHPWWQEAFLGLVAKNPKLASARPDLTKDLSSPSRKKLREADEENCATLTQDSASLLRESQEENQGRESIEEASRPSGPATHQEQAHLEFKSSEPEQGEEDAAESSPPPHVGSMDDLIARLQAEGRSRRGAVLLEGPAPAADPKTEKKRRDAATRAQRQAELKAQARERGEEVEEKKRSGTPLGAVERKWVLETTKYFPEYAAKKLTPRDFGQAKHLLESYDLDQVEIAIEFVCMNWDSICKSILKNQPSKPMPSLGFILGYQATVVPLALAWEKHKATLQEYNSFSAGGELPPAELRQRYQEARKELQALGL